MRTVIISVIFALIMGQPAIADELADAKKIVTESVAFVLETMKDRSLSKEERDQKILTRLSPLFDFDSFGAYCLKGAKILSDNAYKKYASLPAAKQNAYLRKWDKRVAVAISQFREYQELFTPHIKKYYLNKLDLVLKSLEDQEIVVSIDDETSKKIGDKYIKIRSSILLDGETIGMEFWFKKVDGDWKAYNVVIGSTDLGESKGADFLSNIEAYGFDRLLEWLKTN